MIDQKYLNLAKDKAAAIKRSGVAFAQGAKARPYSSASAAAAMILAPMLMKSDDRGYARTAAFTTPLIATGALAIQAMAPSVGSVAEQVVGTHNAWKEYRQTMQSGEVSATDIKNAQKAHEARQTTLARLQMQERSYYRKNRAVKADGKREADALRKSVGQILGENSVVSDSTRRKLSNYYHAEMGRLPDARARFNYATSLVDPIRPGQDYEQWARDVKIPSVAPILEREQLSKAILAQIDAGHSSFVRGMMSKIARMDRSVDPGGTRVNSLEFNASRYKTYQWHSMPSSIREELETHPDLYKRMKSAWSSVDENGRSNIRRKSARRPGGILIKTQLGEDGVEQIKGFVMHTRDRRKGVYVPFSSKSRFIDTGGNTFQRNGAAGVVYTADHVFESDAYAFEMASRGFSGKDIAKSLSRVNTYGKVYESLDESNYKDVAFEGTTLTDGERYLATQKHVASEDFGFSYKRADGMEVADVGWSELSSFDPRGMDQAGIGAAKKYKISPLGTDSGYAKGGAMYPDELAYGLSINPSLEYQDPTFRAVSKDVWMSPPAGQHHPFHRSNVLDLEGQTEHAIGMRVGGLNASEISILGDMPDVTRAADEASVSATRTATEAGEIFTAEKLKRIRARAIKDALGNYNLEVVKKIGRIHHVAPHEAGRIWNQTVDLLAEGDNLRAAKYVGKAGDGDFILTSAMEGAGVNRHKFYDVDVEAFPDWDKPENMGRSLKEIFGDKKGVIGYRGGNEIVAEGFDETFVNVARVEGGMARVTTLETVPFGSGAKLNFGPAKGVVQRPERVESVGPAMVDLVNGYREIVGDYNRLSPEVQAVASTNYVINKFSKKNASDNMAHVAGDVMRRLQARGELDGFMETWRDPLDSVGLVYLDETGTLERDMASVHHLPFRERVRQTQKVMQDMMADAGRRVRDGMGAGDLVFEDYKAAHAAGQAEHLADYIGRNAMPGSARVTDHMSWNVSREVKIAVYAKQKLAMRGFHEAAKALEDRTKYDGDIALTDQYRAHLADEHKIENVMTLDEATSGRSVRSAASLHDRIGTVLDPAFERAKDNYVVRFDDGREVAFLGHDAYGGKTNTYGAGQFSTNDVEAAQMELFHAYRNGATDREKEAAAIAVENVQKKYVHGKLGHTRGGAVDPWASAYRPSTRASSLRYAGNEINPFEVGIGPEHAANFPKSVRDALERGEDVFGVALREPISRSPFVKITLDENLRGSHFIGMDGYLQAMVQGDTDGDRVTLHPFEPGSSAHDQAHGEVFGERSVQRSGLEFYRDKLGGREEQLRDIAGTEGDGYVSLVGGVGKDKIVSKERMLPKRGIHRVTGLASGRDLFLQTALENNSGVVDPYVRENLSSLFFQLTKQTPLTAGKHSATMDASLASMTETYQKMNSALANENGNFGSFIKSLEDLALIQDKGTQGKYRQALDDLNPHLEAFFHGYDRAAVKRSASAISALPEMAEKVANADLGPHPMHYPYAQGSAAWGETASQGADQSASTLGEINDFIRQTAEEGSDYVRQGVEEGKSIFKELRGMKVGKVLGFGLAAAAIAGVATTKLEGPQATFGRRSSSSYRPEESAGVPNQVPGAGDAGSRAPSKPPRHVGSAPAQTNTTVVAPLGETRDLDVQLRARDRQQAHRTAKTMARMATDGDSQVTINYRDRMNPKSLRTRERMREAMGQ